MRAARSPLRTSYGVLHRARAAATSGSQGDDGVIGRGEAAPLEPYDGVPLAAVAGGARRLRRRARRARAEAAGAPCSTPAARPPTSRRRSPPSTWRSGTAPGERAGRPVAELLTDDPLAAVPVNATVGADRPRGRRGRGAAAARRGLRCVKLKVGVGDDAGRVAAARAAAARELALRLDANGAWDGRARPCATIEALAPAGLELVEEPVHGTRGAARGARPRRRCASRWTRPATSRGALASGVADAVCLKVSRCGGICGLLGDGRARRRRPARRSTWPRRFDGPLGIAAAVHCAAALRVQAPCGLATLSLLDLPVPGALQVRDGAIPVPAGPGLF